MHIAEGVLNAPVLVAGAVVSAAGIAWGLKNLNQNNLMFSGMLGAVFFVASLIHIPIGPGSTHLILNGLLGVFLGKRVFPVIFIALLLQVILFQFGGFTVLGVNTATMGIGALFGSWIFQKLNSRIGIKTAGFAAGFGSVFVSGVLTACALGFSNESFIAAAWMIFLSNLAVMVLEGLITMFMVGFIVKVKPSLLGIGKSHA